jgi:adenylate kinase family enzyme
MMQDRDPLIVVDIVVPEAELVRRLGSRLICADCGTNADAFAAAATAVADPIVEPAAGGLATAGTAAAVKAPAEPARCRHCGGALVQRTDDRVAVVLERLKVYHRQTEPLVEYYRSRPGFRSVNGAQAPDQVALALAAAIDSANRSGGR